MLREAGAGNQFAERSEQEMHVVGPLDRFGDLGSLPQVIGEDGEQLGNLSRRLGSIRRSDPS